MEPRHLTSLTPEARLYLAIRDQSAITRYALHHTIKTQNVAEHVGRGIQLMAMFTAQLAQKPSIERRPSMITPTVLLAALRYFAVHDLHESVLSDIPYPVKELFGGLKAMEDTVDSRLMGSLLVMNLSSNEANTCNLLLHVVDMAELVMFCTQEVEMGNRLILPLLQTGIKHTRRDMQTLWDHLHLIQDGDPTVIDAVLERAEAVCESAQTGTPVFFPDTEVLHV